MLENFIKSSATKQIDLEHIINLIGDAKIVLIGESTHGTHEFYKLRAEISKRLIEDKSFNAIAIEGDWPQSFKVNQYIKNRSNIKNAKESLENFQKFPSWMWRNNVTVDFIEWLRQYNSTHHNKIGFYGLDIYSLKESMDEVIKTLENIDDYEAEVAKKRYQIFEKFHPGMHNYGHAVAIDPNQSCADMVTKQLYNIQVNEAYRSLLSHEDFLNLKQNAFLVKNAEKYYRAIYEDDAISWNIRDHHMYNVLENIDHYLLENYHNSKIIIWAHNSHIGDARNTDMGRINRELNLGQLVKENYNKNSFALGFITNSGTVTAAENWDGTAQRMSIVPGRKGSYEEYFHQLDLGDFIINLSEQEIVHSLPIDLLERAIGVVYRPHTELSSHYFHANLAKQFDSLIYIDKTKALEPLEASAKWHKGDLMETYPSGL